MSEVTATIIGVTILNFLLNTIMFSFILFILSKILKFSNQKFITAFKVAIIIQIIITILEFVISFVLEDIIALFLIAMIVRVILIYFVSKKTYHLSDSQAFKFSIIYLGIGFLLFIWFLASLSI